MSLSTYARVNPYGFIETPYRKVENSAARTDVNYLTAMDEKDYPIAQANAELDEKGRFKVEQISARKAGEFVMVPPNEIRFMDVSPNQLVSVSASLIPFLEHDDANRALMGSNMQRQAVPLIQTRAPLVGTGIERIVAKDSGVTIVARREGVVEYVDATRIVVRATNSIDVGTRRRYLQADQVPAFESEYVHQPEAAGKTGRLRQEGPDTCRRAFHRPRRTRARTQRHGGLHELGRLQLRRFDPGE